MMLSLWPKLFDRYDLCARIAPGVMVVLPVAIALTMYVPISLPGSAGYLALYAAATAGLAWVLGAWVRGRGRRAQQRLVAKWGGMPTELLLRHGDPRIESATKARYHEALQAMAPNRPMPTADEETADPAAALQIYRSAVRRLIESRRGTIDNLVLAENASYGFWRNLHGCRLPALTLASAAAIAAVAPDALSLFRDELSLVAMPLHPVLLAAVLLAWGAVPWIMARERRVYDAALYYAERLLATLDRQSAGKPVKERRNSARPRKSSAPATDIGGQHTPAE